METATASFGGGSDFNGLAIQKCLKLRVTCKTTDTRLNVPPGKVPPGGLILSFEINGHESAWD
jgi:hypothetical protein